MNTLTNTAKINKKNLFIQNPVMKRLSKVEEKSSEHVTYKGIAKKCGFFVLMIIAGIALTFLTSILCGMTTSSTAIYPIPFIALLGVATLATLITPFIAIFAKKCTAVAGSIFCASIGIVYTSSALFVESYRNEILLALFVTVALFTALALLFSLNLIKVTQKFKSISYITLSALFITGILVVVSLFIPAISGPVAAIMANPLISIGLSVLGVIVASMFVLVDLQNVRDAVNNQIPKSYEWYGAFGIIFSVIWLFAEVLSLISNIKK